jgi:hypothetical protein
VSSLHDNAVLHLGVGYGGVVSDAGVGVDGVAAADDGGAPDGFPNLGEARDPLLLASGNTTWVDSATRGAEMYI